MAAYKRFVVIGLGSFGSALAEKLTQNGCRVTGMDSCRERVEALAAELYEAVIGNATDTETLSQLGLDAAEGVIISLGEDITQSLLCALHCRELRARHIMVKGVTEDHGKLLRSLGVERVVFPEIEIARELADRLTRPNVVDFLPLGTEYSFWEIAVPDSYVGKDLQALSLRKDFGVWVVGIRDPLSGELRMFPDGTTVLGADQVLLMVGKEADLEKLRQES